MLFILLVFLAIIFVNYLKLKPNSVILFLYGITIGFIEMNVNRKNDLSDSFKFWLSLDPDKLLFYFVPPLIFYASFGIDFHIFRRTFGLILALSIVGIIINCSLISLVLYSLDPVFHNWNSLIVGVILSAIDPIAVAAILPEFTLSEKTINLIEGESLINDEITITLFHLLMNRLIYSDNYSQLAIKWCSLTFGGFLLGFILSICIVPILHRCHGQLISEITTTISFSYFAYYIGEFTGIEFSGIFSIVIVGLFMSVYGKTQIYPDNLIRLNDIWEILAYFSNALIFTLTGLIISYKVQFSVVSLKEWGILASICLLIIILRLIICGLFFSSLKKNILHYDFHDYLNISFSGFRGEISLALSLIVQRQSKLDISIRNGVLFYTAGVTFFTIVFNCIALSIINFIYRKERLLINQNQFDNIRMLLKKEARTFLSLIDCQNEKFHLTKVNLELVNTYLDSNFSM